MKILILTLLLMTGCGGLETLTPQQSLGAGAVAGAVTAKTVEKVKEVFTPEYKLLVHPFLICDISEDGQNGITCFIIPCPSDSTCQHTYSREEWLESNRKVLSVRHSLIANVADFCKANEDACIDFLGYFEGEKVVITED